VHGNRILNGIVVRTGEKVGLASANAVLTRSRVVCNELIAISCDIAELRLK
jgi:hypothetical protein